MSKLFVDKTVEIHATAERVWRILTAREETAEWASEFAGGGGQLFIESDWNVGSPVLWKDKKGHLMVEGNVTAVQPHSLLRFTAFDVHGHRPEASPQDGITCKLTERDGRTVLWLSQGDFSSLPDGAKYRDLSAEIWDRALTRIKRLAERGHSSVR